MYSYTACRRRVENAVRIRKLEQEGREKGKYFNDEEYNRPLDEWIEFVDREEEARKVEESCARDGDGSRAAAKGGG